MTSKKGTGQYIMSNAELKASMEKEGLSLPRSLDELGTLDEFLEEEGIKEEVTEQAKARVAALKGKEHE
jgi:hypothetical protein